ncbi:MAG: DUF389 domain-containing protein [Bellilinea sp.]|jgi:uncharacterized hydrophobic protein (TIGR00271 family)
MSESDKRLGTFTEKILRAFWKGARPLTAAEREEIITDLTPLASPGFDFFLLVVLSTSIATLGLLTNSPAVIIGAMLVAPLMSPILGIGLASVIGDSRMLSSALSALLRGAFLAVILSLLLTIININLPILYLQQLPAEVLSRTHPSPIDLMIALAGGFAAAYALTRENLSAALPGVAIATALMPPLCTIGIGLAFNDLEVAGGASLLFITNAVTIAFAAGMVFFLRGFGSRRIRREKRLPESLFLSAGLMTLLLIPLTFYSLRFFEEANENRMIREVIRHQVTSLNNSELDVMTVQHNPDGLDIVLTIRTNRLLRYEQVVSLQESLVKELNRPVSLKVNQVFAERLDPLLPPTETPTRTLTSTRTIGATPTSTSTSTITPTSTSTLTVTPTETPPLTPTATSLPEEVKAGLATLPPMRIYQSPGGPVIGSIDPSKPIYRLYLTQIYQGLVWVQVRDSDNRIGWIPEIYLRSPASQPTPTP